MEDVLLHHALMVRMVMALFVIVLLAILSISRSYGMQIKHGVEFAMRRSVQ